ncbi:hypothetical protein NL532_00030 [Mesorhizobium sp. C120A]|uniref:hypothetical protein n=1 Tax=unclassified Mesorhizobium TaxID=325217 RepID=UPI0003D05C72|nr:MULTISPECIES: hypothetical protein [unclassified Mesorhizobium]ESZ63770.1 hypothetical protein X728_09115 [Mesorhizobium sp. L103C120A0]WJI45089.1 hypothetical protein NL532_00030 [Mesorhizobium sp. C120A]
MADLIRNMVVSDYGNPRQFLKGPVPANIGPGTLDRLRRAGALAPEAVVEVAEVIEPTRQLVDAGPNPNYVAPKGKAK